MGQNQYPMRHYLLGLFYVLENTPTFQMQSTNAILFTRVIFCFREYPHFPNEKCKCDIIYWGYFLFQRIPPFKMQSTNAILFTGVMFCIRECIPFPNAKNKCDIITCGYLMRMVEEAEYPKGNHDQGQATGKLYHLWLPVECTLFCNLQSRAQAHALLVMGLQELLDPMT